MRPQVRPPCDIVHVRLAAGYIPDVLGVGQEPLEVAALRMFPTGLQ